MSEQGLPFEMMDQAASGIQKWGNKACRAVGVTKKQYPEVEREMHRIYAALEDHLKQHSFMLGDYPTAADAVVVGGLKAHFLFDEYARETILSRYPRVTAWGNQVTTFDRATLFPLKGKYIDLGLGKLPALIDTVLREMSGPFTEFVLGTREALQQKHKSFVMQIYGEEVSFLTRPYIEQSRKMLEQKLNNLLSNMAPAEQLMAAKLLQKYKLDRLYTLRRLELPTNL